MKIDRKDITVIAALMVYGVLASGVGFGKHEHEKEPSVGIGHTIEDGHEAGDHHETRDHSH